MDEPPDDKQGYADLRWSQDKRLRAVDAIVFWDGRINRADLMRRFGISVPQATNDLRRYMELAPDNLRYDARQKTYVAGEDFQPLFGPPEAEAWLRDGEAGAGALIPVEMTPLPPRRIDPWLLRRVLAARRAGMALRVLYQPMDLPDPSWRWIAPCALVSDGLRWHLRAYNQDATRFEDLLFPRFIEVDGEQPAGAVPPDESWERRIAVHLRPASRLSPSQRAVVAADYGMVDEAITVDLRFALLFLFLQRLGVDRPGALLEVANRVELDDELARHNRTYAAN